MGGHPSWIPRLPGMKRPGGATGGHDDTASGSEASSESGVFHRQYAGGEAPWDIDRAQPEIVALEDAGVFGRRVLDVGCGTGQTALFLASRGHDVVGVDAVPDAIRVARERAKTQGLDVRFEAADVLDVLPDFEAAFDAVTDVGFFHALTDEQRTDFARKLAHALVPGGVYAMLCFSDRVPGQWGPRRVSEAEVRATFPAPEWRVREVRAADLHSAVPTMPIVDANLSLIERV